MWPSASSLQPSDHALAGGSSGSELLVTVFGDDATVSTVSALPRAPLRTENLFYSYQRGLG